LILSFFSHCDHHLVPTVSTSDLYHHQKAFLGDSSHHATPLSTVYRMVSRLTLWDLVGPQYTSPFVFIFTCISCHFSHQNSPSLHHSKMLCTDSFCIFCLEYPFYQALHPFLHLICVSLAQIATVLQQHLPSLLLCSFNILQI
jgi:hypothetical protein